MNNFDGYPEETEDSSEKDKSLGNRGVSEQQLLAQETDSGQTEDSSHESTEIGSENNIG
ncbi:MAG TPA: hypothetical protein VMR95_02000 [Candidatus Binatia bacterium]|nr:hypothetical protein [Candidatus Binatia bacterium]